jgi:hypothetical protein
VAGEGCFTVTRALPPRIDGSPRLRFVFSLTIATRDRALLVELHELLGFGSISDRPQRRAEWEPLSTLTISSRTAHIASTVPFMDAYLLPPTRKRVQYEQWRAALFDYERERPRRVGHGVCSIDACGKPVRGRGLCRSHYYRATGY